MDGRSGLKPSPFLQRNYTCCGFHTDFLPVAPSLSWFIPSGKNSTLISHLETTDKTHKTLPSPKLLPSRFLVHQQNLSSNCHYSLSYHSQGLTQVGRAPSSRRAAPGPCQPALTNHFAFCSPACPCSQPTQAQAWLLSSLDRLFGLPQALPLLAYHSPSL